MKVQRIALVLLLVLVGFERAHAQQDRIAQRASVSRLRGPQDAAVTVYEIADFQCPFCSRFAVDVFPRIDSAYVKPGKVRWIFVNLPLPMHANSWRASEAAMCAGGVSGQFWPMHDRLFENQATWAGMTDPTALFAKYAKDIGVPADSFAACVSGDAPATLVVRDILFASSARVTGTPAYIINNESTFTGYKTFEDWKDILETALKKAAGTAK